MEIPINCPICNHPLQNTFNAATNDVVYKNCRLRPDHIFSCAVFLNNFNGPGTGDVVDRVAFTLSMSPLLSVEIHPEGKFMSVDRSASDNRALLNDPEEVPFYVEPDFSDYPKLCNKIKIYLLFS